MLIHTKNNQSIYLKRLHPADHAALSVYLQKLSPETKRRFGPHPFDLQSITTFFETPEHLGFVAYDVASTAIVAYALVKIGYLEHDRARLESYGLTLDSRLDATFAPSVADAWQGQGLGPQLFQFVLTALKQQQVQRVILWGGVQLDNHHAVQFYGKNGFRTLGQFSYGGENLDMICEGPWS